MSNCYGGLNDFELLRAALEGAREQKEGAWRELQRRHGLQVTARARRTLWGGKCCDPNDHCRDVSQETWKQLCASARWVLEHRREGAEGLGGLLHTMCKREALRHLERDCFKRGRAEPYDAGDGEAARPEADIFDFPRMVESANLAQQAWREVGNVRVRGFAEVFKLRAKGLTFAQIAEQLDLKPVTVRQTFRRGVLELRRRLKG